MILFQSAPKLCIFLFFAFASALMILLKAQHNHNQAADVGM